MPLAGLVILDFSTLLPGPLATLMLAEAGADVIKVERDKGGDEMRARFPRFGSDSASFAMLNRGKRSVAINLKDPAALERLTPLIVRADVLVEQFRPGVMNRLGLGYSALRKINPRLIYCSLTGYGQRGTRAQKAGHDLNYLAESGLLSLVSGKDGTPALPPVPLADIAGGSYPLVINILLALRRRDRTGEGHFLDVAMTNNLSPFGYWILARASRGGEWPRADGEALTGALARYRNYRTRDGRFIALGALEDKFWDKFCDLADVPDELRDDRRTPAETISAVTTIIAQRNAAEWQQLFDTEDICCSLVKTIQEAEQDRMADECGKPLRHLVAGEDTMPALPLPIDDALRRPASERAAAPILGEANDMLKSAS